MVVFKQSKSKFNILRIGDNFFWFDKYLKLIFKQTETDKQNNSNVFRLIVNDQSSSLWLDLKDFI